MQRPNVHIVGWGHALPGRIVTNAELAELLDTSDDWIVSRTGIRQRRIATDGENTSTLGALAARRALDRAKMDGTDVDAIICATSTPDCLTPATACLIQDRIGAGRAFAFDVSAGCTGFLFALRTASALIADGAAEKVVVVGAEVMSRVVDWSDRDTCVLFGDGAGAVVLQALPMPGGLQACELGSDGAGASLISIGRGTRRHTAMDDRNVGLRPFVEMQGSKVFAFATRALRSGLGRLLTEQGMTVDDVAMLVPHQSNLRIIHAAAARLGIPLERVVTTIDRTANTASASIAIALSEAADRGALAPGDKVVLIGCGAGLTWATAWVEWTAPPLEEGPEPLTVPLDAGLQREVHAS